MTQAKVLGSLYDILSLRRAHGSLGESKLIDNFIIPTGAIKDHFGNYMLMIGNSNVLWSSHTDTVHYTNHNASNIRQSLVHRNGIISTSNGTCLGADCGTGVWLMLQMIKAEVPGLYVFHRQEETGALGAQYINGTFDWANSDIRYAIAFDRYGTNSIITHQGGIRTCSDEFADSLSTALGMGHKSDPHGSFTDTKIYRNNIPECTNLSVGYDYQHSAHETQDTGYLLELLDALLAFDESKLELHRTNIQNDVYDSYGYGYPNYSEFTNFSELGSTQKPLNSNIQYSSELVRTQKTMFELISDHPNAIESLLHDLGYDARSLERELYLTYAN